MLHEQSSLKDQLKVNLWLAVAVCVFFILALGLLWFSEEILGFGLLGTAVVVAVVLPLMLYGLVLGLKRYLDKRDRLGLKKH